MKYLYLHADSYSTAVLILKEHKIAIDAKFLRKQYKKREFMNAPNEQLR